MNAIETAIKNLLEEDGQYVIATTAHAPHATILAREALRCILHEAGKKVAALPDMPHDLAGMWADILSPRTEAMRQKISITIPKEKSQEVQYREEKGNAIFLVTPKEYIAPEEVAITLQKPIADAAFLFFPETSASFSHITEKVELPEKDKIVFLLENDRTLAEKIYDIALLCRDDQSRDKKKYATLLYFSLVCETNNFSFQATPGVFHLAKTLLEEGADKDIIRAIQEKQKNLPHANLLGRALARTQIDTSRKSSWTFLTQKDFQKSIITPEQKDGVVQSLIFSMQSHLPSLPVSFVLWEKNPHIEMLMWSNNQSLLSHFASHLHASHEGSLCKGGVFQNFTEAELTLRKLLKGAKYDTIM